MISFYPVWFFWFLDLLGLRKTFNAPGQNCFIYCENSEHQGHVYFGTKSNCVCGTGSADDFNMHYVEYYVWLRTKYIQNSYHTVQGLNPKVLSHLCLRVNTEK